MISESEKMITLIEKLEKSTSEGKSIWVPTSENLDSFMLKLGKGTIAVYADKSSQAEEFETPNVMDYFMRIYNEKGVAIDDVNDVDLEAKLKGDVENYKPGSSYRMMKKLYEAIRRSTLGVDTLLDSFIEILDR